MRTLKSDSGHGLSRKILFVPVIILVMLSHLLILRSCTTRRAYVVTVSGRIRNPADDYLRLIINKHTAIIKYQDSLLVHTGDSVVDFHFTFPQDTIRLGYLKDGSKMTRLFLEPGDSLYIQYDKNHSDATLDIQGRGSGNNMVLNKMKLMGYAVSGTG